MQHLIEEGDDMISEAEVAARRDAVTIVGAQWTGVKKKRIESGLAAEKKRVGTRS